MGGIVIDQRERLLAGRRQQVGPADVGAGAKARWPLAVKRVGLQHDLQADRSHGGDKKHIGRVAVLRRPPQQRGRKQRRRIADDRKRNADDHVREQIIVGGPEPGDDLGEVRQFLFREQRHRHLDQRLVSLRRDEALGAAGDAEDKFAGCEIHREMLGKRGSVRAHRNRPLAIDDPVADRCQAVGASGLAHLVAFALCAADREDRAHALDQSVVERPEPRIAGVAFVE